MKPLVHGSMHYKCEKCGVVFVMNLEEGVEGANKIQPCPFTITHTCGGLATHVEWQLDKFFEPRSITEGSNYFALDLKNICGKPVFDYKKESEVNMKLEVGQVVEVSDAGEIGLSIITVNNEGKKCVSGKRNWFPVSELNEKLIAKDRKDIMITKIYGRTFSMDAYKISTDDRTLIWEREDRKELPEGINHMKKLYELLNLEEFGECPGMECDMCPLVENKICDHVSDLTAKIDKLNETYKLDGE